MIKLLLKREGAMKGKLILGTIVLALVMLAPLSCTEPKSEPMILSNYPKLFEKDAMIIVGKNASQVELQSAEEIAAKLEELTGNKPAVKNDTALTEDDKANYNLILVGTPKSTSILPEVYKLTNVTKVPQEWPTEYTGMLEILSNPWNGGKVLLLVIGSDERGVKAASVMVTNDDRIKELEGKTKTISIEEGLGPYVQTVTVPSGYLLLRVFPGDISAHIGEQIKIRCKISAVINTPVGITSTELVFFDSRGSLLRKQPMEMTDYWSAYGIYTIIGDEASYRLLVNYSAGTSSPKYFSEYTVDAFRITINQ